MPPRSAQSVVCALALLALLGCGATQPAPKSVAQPAVAEEPPLPVTPVPETLAFDASRFGLTMESAGWTWKVLRRNVTRFDWSGRSVTKGDAEVLYSFYMEKLDETSSKLLPQLVGSAAANQVALDLAPQWPMASIYLGATLCR